MSQFNIGCVMLGIWAVVFVLVSLRTAIRERVEAIAFAIVWAGVVRRRAAEEAAENLERELLKWELLAA